MENNKESTQTKGLVQVYKSTDTVPCEPWFAPADAEVAYPFTADKPDASLKVPKYDWANRRWIEMDGAVQGQQLADVKEQVQSLSKDINEGKKTDTEMNQQLGSLVKLLSAIPTAEKEPAKEGSDK